jgi:hypothetical protein
MSKKGENNMLVVEPVCRSCQLPEYQRFRDAVLAEVLKLISGKVVEVDQTRLEIKTFMSEGYHPENLPRLATSNLQPPLDQTVSFDTVSREDDPMPTTYRWCIILTDT